MITHRAPVVIAHRGACGYLPEHTLESKALAHGMGADFLEQDLVLSRDGIPVVLHDLHLEGVTDAPTRFPGRRRADGHWYAIDLSWEELSVLRVRERVDPRTGQAVFPNRFPAPPDPRQPSLFRLHTLDQELTLIRGLNRSTGRTLGIYPELKEPAWHQAQGQDPVDPVLEVLARHGYLAAGQRIYIQCFEPETLKRVHAAAPRIPLVQLIGEPHWWPQPPTDFVAMRRPEGLAKVRGYAAGIGPWIGHLLSQGGVGEPPVSTHLLEQAHRAGLLVHAYTLRRDLLPAGFAGFEILLRTLLELGIDGVFTDFPDLAVRGRAAWLCRRSLA